MSVEIKLETSEQHTAYAPLAVIGHCITQSGLLNPVWLELLKFQPKSYEHKQKLLIKLFIHFINLF